MNEQLTNLLIKKLKEQANKNRQRFIQQVAVWIAEILLSETKTEITNEFDPVWDTSGITLNTDQLFNIKDYTSLDSFIENEYNGTSQPSFISGMGLFHNVYANELEELITEWISLQFEETIHQLLKDRNELLLEYLALREITHDHSEVLADLYEEDSIGDVLILEFPIELRESLGKMDINLLFKIGQIHAQENIRHKEVEHQRKNEELYINVGKAEKYWNKICKLHKLRYQKDMPHKVEKPYYDQYVYPILVVECMENNDTINNIRLLGMHLGHKFSNSVALKLSFFKCNV